MPNPILSTKVYVPHPQTNSIRRPHLTGKLLAAVESPGAWTLLSGPAGFGKTTLLGEFIEQYRQPVAWLTLDAADNDPVRFWTYFVTACQTTHPGFGAAALNLFSSPQPVPEDAIPAILVNDAAAIKKGLILILDDYHLIHNQSIHTGISFLLEHIPDQFHLVLSTRIDPPWPLARFRASGKLIEIRAADLRFSLDEAGDFLQDTMGLPLSPGEVAALEKRTEGWIAGLQLAAISMKGRKDTSGFVQAFTGSHTYVADYLVEEVLRHQPAEIQSFLLQTSILTSLTPSLCDEVTGMEAGGAILPVLQKANLFILPLDDEGHWFRYHHLFADLLQARLQQSTSPEGIASLHRRAAAWYEKNGFPMEAVNHALAAKDFTLAARLVEDYSYPLATRGELATLLSWIDALPPSVSDRPQFLLAQAWALLFAGDAQKIMALLTRFDAQTNAHPDLPQSAILKGSAAAIRAFFLLMAGDHAHALELARQAESLLPSPDSELAQDNPFLFSARSILPYTLGMAYRSKGDYESAVEAFEQEVRMFSAPAHLLGWTIATIEVAVVRRLQGRLHESEEICRRALERITEQGAYFSGSLARIDATMSEVLREYNRLDEALQRVTGALERMRNWNMPTDRLAIQISLLRVQFSRGDLAGVRENIQNCKNLRASGSVFHDLSRSLDLLEARLALESGDLPLAGRLLESLKPSPFPVVFLREQELVLQARLFHAQGKFAEALAILQPLCEETKSSGRYFSWMEVSAQLALSFACAGEHTAAISTLVHALQFGAGEGFARVFLDLGPEMQPLLSAAASQPGVDRKYVGKLLDLFPGRKALSAHPSADQKEDGLIEPLTAREQEVLNLIAQGDSNQAIAEKLVITVSAVKKHTGNIFGKLSVNSRTQAIARARKLGILAVDS